MVRKLNLWIMWYILELELAVIYVMMLILQDKWDICIVQQSRNYNVAFRGAKFVSGGGGAKFLDWSTFRRVLCWLKKKGHLANKLFYLSSSFLLVFNKTKHHFEPAARERGVWLGILGERKFYLGGAAPFCGPVVQLISSNSFFLMFIIDQLKWKTFYFVDTVYFFMLVNYGVTTSYQL